jgi:hypothetical protein
MTRIEAHDKNQRVEQFSEADPTYLVCGLGWWVVGIHICSSHNFSKSIYL